MLGCSAGALGPLAPRRALRALLTLAKEGIGSFSVVYADDAVPEQARKDAKLAALDIRWVLNASRASVPCRTDQNRPHALKPNRESSLGT